MLLLLRLRSLSSSPSLPLSSVPPFYGRVSTSPWIVGQTNILLVSFLEVGKFRLCERVEEEVESQPV